MIQLVRRWLGLEDTEESAELTAAKEVLKIAKDRVDESMDRLDDVQKTAMEIPAMSTGVLEEHKLRALRARLAREKSESEKETSGVLPKLKVASNEKG